VKNNTPNVAQISNLETASGSFLNIAFAPSPAPQRSSAQIKKPHPSWESDLSHWHQGLWRNIVNRFKAKFIPS
jgi:hypothetical protein